MMETIVVLIGVLMGVATIICACVAVVRVFTEKLPDKLPEGINKTQWTRPIAFFSYVGITIFVCLLLSAGLSDGLGFWQYLLWLVILVVLFSGCIQTAEKERTLKTIFGALLNIDGPGPTYTIPIIMDGIKIDTREQSIDVFPAPTEKDEINIDFFGGGSAVLVDAKIWFKILGKTEEELRENILKCAYGVVDYKARICEEGENAYGAYLRSQKVEEIFERYEKNSETNWWPLVKDKFKASELLDRFTGWGVEILAITTTDFSWSEDVLKMRGKVYESARQIEIAENLAEVAEHNAKEKAHQIAGFHDEMFQLLRKVSPPDSISDKELHYIVQRYVMYKQGTDTGRITDIRGGDLDSSIVRVNTILDSIRKQQQQPTQN